MDEKTSSNAKISKLEIRLDHHDGCPEETVFNISDWDQTIPAVFSLPYLIFRLPENTRKQDIMRNLQRGLQNVISSIPIVGGKLHTDGVTKNIKILRKNKEAVSLYVRDFEDQDPSIFSYEKLAANGFSLGKFTESTLKLVPDGFEPTRSRRDDGCPVSVFQVNFIRGGLILSLGLHHMCGDAKSIDHIFSLWAESARAAASNCPMPNFTPDLSREYFSAALKPSAEEIVDLKNSVQGFKFCQLNSSEHGYRVNNDPPSLREISVNAYHFSIQACKALKETCEPPGPGEYVSTYDCIAAVTWQAMTRARFTDQNQTSKQEVTNFTHAVDTRKRFPCLVQNEYFGNGFFMAVTEPVRIEDLTATNGLAKAALTIRKSILKISEKDMPNILRLQRGLEGTEKMSWNYLPQNPICTSWTGLRVFEAYDFGFGQPNAIRVPIIPFDGSICVVPTASGQGKSSGFDAIVCLEKKLSERMRMDTFLTKYCEFVY